MAEIATVARPYAEAVFRSALDKSALREVGESLALVAAIARDERMQGLLANPKASTAQKRVAFSFSSRRCTAG